MNNYNFRATFVCKSFNLVIKNIFTIVEMWLILQPGYHNRLHKNQTFGQLTILCDSPNSGCRLLSLATVTMDFHSLQLYLQISVNISDVSGFPKWQFTKSFTEFHLYVFISYL